jgi:hypothetical protein
MLPFLWTIPGQVCNFTTYLTATTLKFYRVEIQMQGISTQKSKHTMVEQS